MAISDRVRRIITERDGGKCWHCGETEGLQVHHRRNRGMGGSRELDRYDNLILVCSRWNLAMEADADAASEAREFGHKLGSCQDFTNPVFDRTELTWYKLTEDGRREKTLAPSYLI
jgi:hypothetical protein